MALGGSPNQSYDYTSSSNSWENIASFSLSETATGLLKATVVGREQGGTDAVAVDIRGLFRRETGGVVTAILPGVFDTLLAYKTLGAVLWDVRLRLNSDSYVYLDVKGKLSTNVKWCAQGTFDSWVP